jgi:GT2 family glycosyltransferase
MSEAAALVSIVVLTFNRRVEVLRTLAMLTALSERAQIIVVDNASADGSAAAIAEQFPGVSLVRLHRNFGAAGRNFGVLAARTPYVAFCDDDTWWAPGSVARAVEILEAHPEVALTCARILIGDSRRLDWTSNRMANSPLEADGLPGRAILGFMAGASVVRVSAFEQVGGYSDRLFLGCEEELMALDLAAQGWRMLYCDELIVHHYPSQSRHARARDDLAARNAVWVACLRLPWSEVVRRARTLLRLRGVRMRALWQTAHGLPWVLSERRRIPLTVEGMRQRIVAQDRAGAKPLLRALIQRARDR